MSTVEGLQEKGLVARAGVFKVKEIGPPFWHNIHNGIHWIQHSWASHVCHRKPPVTTSL